MSTNEIAVRYKWPEIPLGEETKLTQTWYVVYLDGTHGPWTAYRDKSKAEQHASRGGADFVVAWPTLPPSC